MHPLPSTAWAVALPLVTLTACWIPAPEFDARLDLKGYTLTQALERNLMSNPEDVPPPAGLVFASPAPFFPLSEEHSFPRHDSAQAERAVQSAAHHGASVLDSPLRP